MNWFPEPLCRLWSQELEGQQRRTGGEGERVAPTEWEYQRQWGRQRRGEGKQLWSAYCMPGMMVSHGKPADRHQGSTGRRIRKGWGNDSYTAGQDGSCKNPLPALGHPCRRLPERTWGGKWGWAYHHLPTTLSFNSQNSQMCLLLAR